MKWSGALGLALASAIAACTSASDGPVDPGPPEVAPVASVVLSPQLAESEVGATYWFEAVTLDAAGTVLVDRPVAWASSDPAVASIDSAGMATANSPGSAEL